MRIAFSGEAEYNGMQAAEKMYLRQSNDGVCLPSSLLSDTNKVSY